MGKKAQRVTTPIFRVSYPQVFEPKVNETNGKSEYSVVALFKPGEDLSELKAACSQAIADKWGDKKPKQLMSPFRDQGDRRNQETDELPDGYVEGAIFITLRTKDKPGIIGPRKVDGEFPKIESPEDFYAGCWARATVTCFAWEYKNDKGVVIKRGVSFGLSNLQKAKDDMPFSGRRKAEEDFAPIEGGETDASEVDDPFAD